VTKGKTETKTNFLFGSCIAIWFLASFFAYYGILGLDGKGNIEVAVPVGFFFALAVLGMTRLLRSEVKNLFED
jgi:hypothetical protein